MTLSRANYNHYDWRAWSQTGCLRYYALLEKTLDKTDRINEKKTAAQAQEAGRHSQIAVDFSGTIRRVSERQRDGGGDQRHSRHRSHAENEKVRDSPKGIVNHRQDEQC